MRALLTTTGSEGDFQPFLAFAERLVHRGHDVLLAAADRYAAQAEARGIPFRAIGHPWSEARTHAQFTRILAQKNPLKQLALVVELLEEEQRTSVPHLRALVRDRDVVVYPPLLVAAVAAARAENVRHVSVHLAPLHRAQNYSPMGPNFGRFGNAILWSLASAMMRRETDAKLNAIVAAAGLAPWRDVLLESSHSTLLDLVAVSPSVLPRDPLSKPHTQITGYFFVDPPPQTPIPKELEAFVEAEPPLVIGFGSMTGFDAAAMTRAVLEAVSGLGRRVVLQAGWAGLGAIELPSNVMRAEFVSHAWLHARAVGVVHHGGAGTTASALRAGVPQAIVWHLGDQPVWGRKMHELGVAPAPCAHHDFSAAWLRATLERLLTDDSLRSRARALGEAVRAEDGTGVAAAAIEGVT